jgi:anti-anti-sigma factor
VAVSSAFPEPLVGLQVTEYGPDARVVTVTGEVDALIAPTLAACLSAQLAVAQVVVVDLDDLKFLASAGLRVLFEINELAIERDRHLRFVCNCPLANLALETTGLRQHLTFADDVANALATDSDGAALNAGSSSTPSRPDRHGLDAPPRASGVPRCATGTPPRAPTHPDAPERKKSAVRSPAGHNSRAINRKYIDYH